jgi:hypothetical protein
VIQLPLVPGAVSWLPWGGEAFARARAQQKPVLLSIGTAWSSSCREMDRTSYADPAVVALIHERFVPVRVDADRRPDVSERYSLGGWPTTAFVTPDGEIIGGGTFVETARLVRVLAQAADMFARKSDTIARRAAEVRDRAAGAGPAGGEAPAVEELCERIFAAVDPEYGGFGAAPKFPHTAPVHLALALNGTHADPRLETLAVRTLDAMGWGGLYDEIDGGFFRCAATRDWRQPERGKLLDVNADLLALYLSAGATLGVSRFTERAADVLRFVQNWLADPLDGGWQRSEGDTALYCDGTAAMVSAALRAAARFEDTGLLEFALKSLERVALACYKPGHGVAHYHDGAPRVRGLLADQSAMAAAHLDAFEATGNIVYEMMAEELAHYAVRVMWDDRGGGFFDSGIGEDGAEPIGLMRLRQKPFVANCEAARMLLRLSATSGETEFGRLAEATLTSIAPRAAGHGPLAAHYVLAARELAGR